MTRCDDSKKDVYYRYYIKKCKFYLKVLKFLVFENIIIQIIVLDC